MKTHNSAAATKSTDHTIKMKSGSVFTAPVSWKMDTFENYVQMTSPENDFSVYFLELPLTLGFENIAAEAWKQVQSNSNLQPAQQTFPPVVDDWEKIYQINYDVPVSESRTVIAIIRTFKDRAYVCLLDGKMAGISRRASDFTIMFGSWRPVGFKETQLNKNKIKDWVESDIQSFEKFVADSMQKLKIPGVSVAIIRQDGKSIYKKGFGVKQVGSDDPVTTDTLFMIGSITKPLTTLLMAALVDQKKLSWETPITNIFKNFSVDDPDLTEKLTMRHTVSASTGMPSGELECLFKFSGVTAEERLLEMKEMKPTTKIGETFQYSNYLVMAGGYAAARAYIPEGNLENAYALAMKKLIFDPLQMNKTVIKIEDALKLGAALPHAIDFNGDLCKVPLNIEKFAYSVAPAGAVWSTVSDMSKYLLIEMNKGIFEGKPIISEETILERRKPGIRCTEKISYGLCLAIGNEQGLNIIGHGGATIGFSSDFFILPEKGLGMVILSNAALVHPFLSAVRQKFIELTFSAKPRAEDMIDAMFKERNQVIKKKHETIFLDPIKTQWIENLLGIYSNHKLGSAKLSKANNGKDYEIEFEEWKTRVGTQVEPNGKKVLILIDPPSYCGMKLLVEDNGNKLVLDEGHQEQYDFVRIKH